MPKSIDETRASRLPPTPWFGTTTSSPASASASCRAVGAFTSLDIATSTPGRGGSRSASTGRLLRTLRERWGSVFCRRWRVDSGDPSGEREAFRAAPTVNNLLDRYIAEQVERRNRPGTQAEFKSIVERNVRPELGHLKVASVTRQDMHKFHAGRSATPRQGNLILAVCSKAFSLAELWEMRPEGSNPCSRIERYPENHRERFLTGEELGRLGATLRRAESAGLPRKSGRTLYRRVR